ncbi:winged helix-turn-helix domain-containing protein [Nonomuraea sp. NPDC049709]|uniref:AfsR/SARP family transcriptional regulator n=1 Tax=Nonomuraea sp. NPDC049709 TaxID=3154736 RepID=UPI0034203E4D
MRVKVLGPWEPTAGSEALPLTGSRRVSLLARLALSAGQVVTARQLLEDVWGDGPTATAPEQLHIVVSKIREHLTPYVGDDFLVTTPGGHRLDLPRDHVDAHEFSHLFRAARAVRRQGELAAADRMFRGATGRTGSRFRGGSSHHRRDETLLVGADFHGDGRFGVGRGDGHQPETCRHAGAL